MKHSTVKLYYDGEVYRFLASTTKDLMEHVYSIVPKGAILRYLDEESDYIRVRNPFDIEQALEHLPSGSTLRLYANQPQDPHPKASPVARDIRSAIEEAKECWRSFCTEEEDISSYICQHPFVQSFVRAMHPPAPSAEKERPSYVDDSFCNAEEPKGDQEEAQPARKGFVGQLLEDPSIQDFLQNMFLGGRTNDCESYEACLQQMVNMGIDVDQEAVMNVVRKHRGNLAGIIAELFDQQ